MVFWRALPGKGTSHDPPSDQRPRLKASAYIVHQYKLRSRYDRLRARGMLTKQEAAARLNIHEGRVARVVEIVWRRNLRVT